MLRKSKIKSLITLVLAAAMLLSTGTVMASSDGFTASTARLFVDGNEVATSHGDNEPFIIDGTTYLSIRALSTALGVDINWRPETSTVYIDEAPQTEAILITAGDTTNVFTVGDVLKTGEPVDITTQVGDDFVGWALAEVLQHLLADSIDTAGIEYVIITAANGTVAAVPAAEALDPENGYLIFEEDRGSIRLIMAQATSRGTWIRDILEISIGAQAPHSNIGIIANGQEVTPTNVHGNVVEPFMVDGVIYLPLRAVADALNMAVNWDGEQNIIFIGDMPEETDLNKEAAFTVTAGTEVYTVTMSEFEAIGLVEFYAVDRRGGGEVRIDFTGVPIAAILESLEVELSLVKDLTFTAANGNTGVIPASEALNPEYGFLAVTENGEKLTSWADGGAGPFRLVLAQDSFPQRWLRNVVDIAFELGDAQTAETISITGADGLTFTADMADILDVGPVTVTWLEDEFTGVPLAALFRHIGVDYEGGLTVTMRSADGFVSVLSIEEALDETNAFIVFEQNGGPVPDGLFASIQAQSPLRRHFVRGLVSITIYTQTVDADEIMTDLGEYEFAIIFGGRAYIASLELLKTLDVVTFDVAADRNFTGVSLVAILEYFDIDYSAASSVRIMSQTHDTAWTAEEAFDAERGFIAFLENGEELRERDYPFRSVLVGGGSNRWTGQVRVITLI